MARWQADWVTTQLEKSGVAVEQILITTTGDREQQGPVGTFGGVGVFTKEIQRALLEERIDMAVHSLKDLPTEPVEGLCLAVVPERGAAGRFGGYAESDEARRNSAGGRDRDRQSASSGTVAPRSAGSPNARRAWQC